MKLFAALLLPFLWVIQSCVASSSQIFSSELLNRPFSLKDSIQCGNPSADREILNICHEVQRQWFIAHQPIYVEGLDDPLSWKVCEPYLTRVWANADEVVAQCEIGAQRAIRDYFSVKQSNIK